MRKASDGVCQPVGPAHVVHAEEVKEHADTQLRPACGPPSRPAVPQKVTAAGRLAPLIACLFGQPETQRTG